MTNTSATGGYLIPFTPAPGEDGSLDQALQPILAGITGFDPSLVRRKWQEVSPPTPPANVTWLAFGAIDESADTNAALVHNPQGDGGLGNLTSYRTEETQIMASFYGPDCASYAAGLRDGFGIGQNREAMQRAGIAFVQNERLTKVPELRGEGWVRRVDVVFRIRRTAARTYRIRNIIGVTGQVQTDTGVTAPIGTLPSC